MALQDLFPTDVSGVDVEAPKKKGLDQILGAQLVDTNPQVQPMPQPVLDDPNQSQPPQGRPDPNYDNSGAQSSLMQVMRAMRPDGGSTNPGVYGLLPSNLQHGNLRNILGAIGDAFLVQGGKDATYAPRMQRQAQALAMAGVDPNDADSVRAASQRVAATGTPGAMEEADKMVKNYNDADYKRQTVESNRIYRQSMTESRQDQALQRAIPTVGAMVRNTRTPEQYQAAYDRAELLAQRIGPDYHATDFGLVRPEDWTPEASQSAGLTSNNMLVSQDKGLQRRTAERGQDIGYKGRVDSANINANGRIATTGMSVNKPTDATILNDLIQKQNQGEDLTPAEQYTFDHMTQVSKKPRRLPSAVKPGASAGPRRGLEPSSAPAGTSPQVVTNGDVALLKQHANNPKARQQFDAYFGKGAAKKYLGN